MAIVRRIRRLLGLPEIPGADYTVDPWGEVPLAPPHMMFEPEFSGQARGTPPGGVRAVTAPLAAAPMVPPAAAAGEEEDWDALLARAKEAPASPAPERAATAMRASGIAPVRATASARIVTASSRPPSIPSGAMRARTTPGVGPRAATLETDDWDALLTRAKQASATEEDEWTAALARAKAAG